MTVTLASAGTPTSATGSATAPAPAFPATVNAGQYALLCVNIKLWSATCATPSGWTLLGETTNGSTDGTVNTGSTRVVVYGKECDGTEDGSTVTLTIASGNSSGAVIHTFDTSLGGWAAPVVATGSKVGNSANMSAASGTQTDVLAGDLFVIFFSQNASLGTPSADTLTQTGVTFGTVTNRSDVAITTGNDSRNRVNTVPVTSVIVPALGATAGYTNASSTSGTVAFVRLRDVADAVTGIAAAAFGFTGTATGQPRTFGAAVATFGFDGTALGVDRALGVAAATFGFTGTAAGQPRTFGAAAASFGFTGTSAGVDRALGQALATFGFTGTASGIDRALGIATALLGFTGSASGVVGNEPVLGAAAGSFGFTGSASGVPRTFGVAVATFDFTGAAAGQPETFGLAVVAFGFTGSASGTHTVLGVAVAAFGFTGTALGSGGGAVAAVLATSSATVTDDPVASTAAVVQVLVSASTVTQP